VSSREVDQELEQLRKRYREKFERELELLAEQLRDAERSGYARPRLEAIRGLAHRLMGTSGSYGLEASSDALARMEERIEALLASAEADAGAAWPEIESELVAARDGLNL
jgi:chemotaxis protein histidine kinase CheA